MLKTLRQIHPLAFWSLGVALSGVLLDTAFHFLPPNGLPAYARWLDSLSAVDYGFFVAIVELAAHFLVGLGLTGCLGVLIYEVITRGEGK